MSKLREQAAKLLTDALGREVWAEDIECATGFWKQQDVYRWEVCLPADGPHLAEHVGCWETLREFVAVGRKNGVGVKRVGSYTEVYPIEEVRHDHD